MASMADEPATSKLKSKSKWGKLLHKDKSGGSPHFKLNEDVVDFLKPSTEKYSGEGTRQWSSAPRIDVAISSRWPEPGDVKRAVTGERELPHALETRPNGRPRRKQHLAVSFARTTPEIIGEGGDEAEAPVMEISRAKAKAARSFSDRRPPASFMVPGVAGTQGQQPANRDPISQPPRDPYVSARPDIHRSKTSAGETSYHVGQKAAQPQPRPLQEQQQQPKQESEPRPGLLKRAPTGFSEYEEDMSPVTPDEPLPTLPQLPIMSPLGNVSREEPIHSSEATYSDQREPSSPIAPSIPESRIFVEKAQHRMNAEGRTFRRVSRQEYSVEDLASLQNPPNVDSPPRVQPGGQDLSIRPGSSRKAMPDRHFVPEEQSIPEREPVPHRQSLERKPMPDYQHIKGHHPTISISSDDGRADSMKPKITPAQDQQAHLLDSHYSKSRTPTPTRNEMNGVSRIDTGYGSHTQDAELMLSPVHSRKKSLGSEAGVPGLSALQSPDALHPRGQNFSRLGGFQGITPTPNQGPTTSYFAPHPSQTNSQQAASPSSSYDPYQANSRPSSQNSHYKPFAPLEGQSESLEYVAYTDFDARVAHMRGVFRLTAEREHPISAVSPRSWLRAAIWWLHRGRAGLGHVVRNTPRGPDGQKRDLLTQAHVDVAKAWWILADLLEDVGSPLIGNPSSQDSFKRDIDVVRSHLRSLTLSMKRNDVMPPHQSLIQGQDTTIWIQYPRFAPDAAAMLRGQKPLLLDDDKYETDPLEALPAGDTPGTFFYNRMFVDVSINTEEAETDRVVLPCILTMLRSKTDFQPTIVISSQTDLVNVCVRPGDGGHGKGSTWHDVQWKGRSHGIYVRLPRGFDLNVEFQENDFRGLRNMVDYTKKIQASFSPQPDERLVHEARLAELQYSDSSNPHAFPRDRVRSCTALVFERFILRNEGTGARKLHRGFRFLLVTNPINKTLSSVTHEIGTGLPFLFENMGNPAAKEVPAMVVRIQEGKRSCKILLIFNRVNERQHLYDILNGIVLASDEAFASKAPLKSTSIEPAFAYTPGSNLPGSGVLKLLHWDAVRVINKPIENGRDPGATVLSDNLRIVATHESGCVTDRMNLGPGELLFRLPLEKPTTIQLLRGPQEDLSLSLSTRNSPPQLLQDLAELMRAITNKPTIRTLTFASPSDLHDFQKSISRFTVRFDNPAAQFAISRRRMVVNISKKLETNKCRIQVLTSGSVTQMAVFFEGWSVADALVLQIRASDVIEKTKAKEKDGTRWCVRFVEAKFTLPKKEKAREEDEEDEDASHEGIARGVKGREWRGMKRGFCNLEGLEYAEEHDDITVGFDREEDRDRFCEQLPAATTTKKFDLRRKI